jgi:hypothetical protein
MYTGLHAKCPLSLSVFNYTWILLTGFRQILKYQISQKSVQWEPSCSIRTDGQTDTTKVIVPSRNFAKAPKNKLWESCSNLLVNIKPTINSPGNISQLLFFDPPVWRHEVLIQISGSGIRVKVGAKNCSLLQNTHTSSGAHQWVPAFFAAVMQTWRQTNYSPPSSAAVTNEWSHTSAPPLCLHGVQRDSFTFIRVSEYISNGLCCSTSNNSYSYRVSLFLVLLQTAA